MDAMQSSSSNLTGAAPKRGVHSSAQSTEVTSHNQYKTDGIDANSLKPSALAQFRAWFEEAVQHDGVEEPEAMVVSTADVADDGTARPSSRLVLLKRIDDRGLVFYSNYTSRKARELASNPFASLTFYWHAMHRSVRIGGRVEKLSKEESQAYFDSRPVGSRIGAIASPQSQPIPDRKMLEERVRAVENEYNVPGAAGLDGTEPGHDKTHDTHIPVPEHWGGYRILPYEIEFWMGRSNRLHDRFRYTRDFKSDKDEWAIDRLAP